MKHAKALTRSKIKVVIASFAAFGATLATGPTALAASGQGSAASSACVKQHSGTTTTRVVADYIVEMRQQGKTQAEIDTALAIQFCWERIGTAAQDVVSPMGASGNGDVSVKAPVFYYDRNLHVWNVSMNWDWVTDSWGGQFSHNLDTEKSVGGADGAGVTLSSGVRITSPIMEYWGKNCHYTGVYTAGPSTANSYGVGFIAQDRAFFEGMNVCSGTYQYADYNMEHGQILFNVDNGGTCTNVHAYGSYNHTWSSTSLNSIGVGPYSISFGWNTNSNQWSWASGGSAWANVC